ncbi:MULTISPECIES: hypothetical protein [Caproicibacterium]|uniref:Uncharacterized protein n=1 Tax=Caproicibacterium argilliputei TaxID=3030016 RepID=A0AA97H2R1_9FIRM|nr:hypothetical protein [Caproicibacterium argilliputei]WOC32522.1 hypothetical protein PXC00_01245 [Caproicibacterium argilliputei]
MKKSQWIKEHKARAILLGVLVVFFAYVGIDQIVFFAQKDAYISKARQYVTDFAQANTMRADAQEQTADQLVKTQIAQISKFAEQYNSDKNNEKAYEGLAKQQITKGYRWGKVAAKNLEVTAAWKSPFQLHSHILLRFTLTADCKAKGMLLYDDGSTTDLDLLPQESAGIQTIQYTNELSVWSGSSKQVKLVSTSTNQTK